MSVRCASGLFLLALFSPLNATGVRAQVSTPSDEIPIERCDILPTVRVRIDDADFRFLLDTGATTVLNLKSFPSSHSKRIRVTSWSGTAATSAREVFLPELILGHHRLRDLTLPAIDLSPIGDACGAQIDGILGVDLLDKMNVTIDLKRYVAFLGEQSAEPRALFQNMEASMQKCATAFENGNSAELENCFDPEIVLYTPHGEFRGRRQVMDYLNERYLKFAPALCYQMTLHDVRIFGDALWYSYEYKIQTPKETMQGHGMSICHRREGHWRVLSMHNSLLQANPFGKPE